MSNDFEIEITKRHPALEDRNLVVVGRITASGCIASGSRDCDGKPEFPLSVSERGWPARNQRTNRTFQI